ncbi:molecular chaperone DnaJ [Sphingomonas solaris]|uniref:molecular chaperone DnaJ n=1 Tax=Alterirhizorhabdus solaris TaxID=2529389 RepID=UPI001EF0DE40|nr:molecular chaperone DnaJ [Sphingomonas solaris]
MSWLLPIAFLIGTWAWATGRWRRIRFADLLAIAAGLLAVRLAIRAEWLPALVGFGWAGGWLWHRRRGRLSPRARPQGTPPAMPVAEALGLLGLPAAADAGMVRAAHRRLIRRVHPDAGGSADLARRVNAARDTLLAELNRNAPRAS